MHTALSYRQPLEGKPDGNAVTAADLTESLCALAPAATGPVLYSLPGEKMYESAADAVVDSNIHGKCGVSDND